eukprot:gene28401-37490_t
MPDAKGRPDIRCQALPLLDHEHDLAVAAFGAVDAVAVAVAAIGVAILIGDALDTLWVSISLALSFGLYGLIRKITPVGSVPGLATETTLLAPLALGAVLYFAQVGGGGFGDDVMTSGLLILAGAVTAIPLLIFATAARRMSYTSLGFVQYTAPSIAFLLAIEHDEAGVLHPDLDQYRDFLCGRD